MRCYAAFLFFWLRTAHQIANKLLFLSLHSLSGGFLGLPIIIIIVIGGIKKESTFNQKNGGARLNNYDNSNDYGGDYCIITLSFYASVDSTYVSIDV